VNLMRNATMGVDFGRTARRKIFNSHEMVCDWGFSNNSTAETTNDEVSSHASKLRGDRVGRTKAGYSGSEAPCQGRDC